MSHHHSARRCGSLEADVPLGCVTVGATNPLTLTTSGRSSWVNKTTGLLSSPTVSESVWTEMRLRAAASAALLQLHVEARHLHNLLSLDSVSSVLVAGSSQSSQRQGHCCRKPTVAELTGEYAGFQFQNMQSTCQYTISSP